MTLLTETDLFNAGQTAGRGDVMIEVDSKISEATCNAVVDVLRGSGVSVSPGLYGKIRDAVARPAMIWKFERGETDFAGLWTCGERYRIWVQEGGSFFLDVKREGGHMFPTLDSAKAAALRHMLESE